MGGILARWWAGIGKDDRNYGAGDINKLITVDSPHYGSPLADILFSLASDESFVKEFRSMQKPIDEGAIRDLQTNSSALTLVNALPTDVPAHAIVGDSPYHDLANLPGGAGDLFSLLHFIGADTRILESNSDLVVEVTSQHGGLQAPQAVTFNRIHFNDQGDGLDGCLETSTIADQAEKLLNAAPNDTGFFRRGFPSTSSVPLSFSANTPQRIAGSQPMTAGGLRITTPANGTSVAPGQTVQVTVEGDADIVPVSVLLASRDRVQIDDIAPFTFDLTIPNEAMGSFLVAAMGKDAAGILFGADVTLQVQPKAISSK